MSDPMPSLRADTGYPRGSARWLTLLGVTLILAGAGLVAALALVRVPPPAPELDLAAAAQDDLATRDYRPLSGTLDALLSEKSYKPVPTQAHPLLGKQAPDFTLPDVDGNPWTLSKEVNQGPVVLVFYYGYHCNHCVSQLFGLSKDIEKFDELGVRVVAVSADPPGLTRERYKKYGAFAFPVLSDPDNKVAEPYGTFTRGLNQGDEDDQLHGTFVIDRDRVVVWVNRGDGPFVENRTLLLEARRCDRPRRPR